MEMLQGKIIAPVGRELKRTEGRKLDGLKESKGMVNEEKRKRQTSKVQANFQGQLHFSAMIFVASIYLLVSNTIKQILLSTSPHPKSTSALFFIKTVGGTYCIYISLVSKINHLCKRRAGTLNSLLSHVLFSSCDWNDVSGRTLEGLQREVGAIS